MSYLVQEWPEFERGYAWKPARWTLIADTQLRCLGSVGLAASVADLGLATSDPVDVDVVARCPFDF